MPNQVDQELDPSEDGSSREKLSTIPTEEAYLIAFARIKDRLPAASIIKELESLGIESAEAAKILKETQDEWNEEPRFTLDSSSSKSDFQSVGSAPDGFMATVLGLIGYDLPAGLFSRSQHSYSATISRIGNWSAGVGGVVGVLLWGVIGWSMMYESKVPEFRNGKQIVIFIFLPFALAAIAYVGGLAFALIFAPRSFLNDQRGQAWLQLIGTKNTYVARIVCTLIATVIIGIPSCVIGFIAYKEYEERARFAYRPPATPSAMVASAETNFDPPEPPIPPTPVGQAHAFCADLDYKVQDLEFLSLTSGATQASHEWIESIDQELEKWSEEPEAFQVNKTFTEKLRIEKWLSLIRWTYASRKRFEPSIMKMPFFTGLEAHQLCEETKEESSKQRLAIDLLKQDSVLVLTRTEKGFGVSRELNTLLSNRVAKSIDDLRFLLVVQKARMPIGVYSSENVGRDTFAEKLDKALEEEPEGNFEDKELKQLLQMKGAFRWMYVIVAIDLEEEDPSIATVYIDDPSKQQTRSFSDYIHHEEQACKKKFLKHIERVVFPK